MPKLRVVESRICTGCGGFGLGDEGFCGSVCRIGEHIHRHPARAGHQVMEHRACDMDRYSVVFPRVPGLILMIDYAPAQGDEFIEWQVVLRVVRAPGAYLKIRRP